MARPGLIWTVLLCGALAGRAPALGATAEDRVTALVGATVIDGTGAAPIEDGMVMISRGRIAAVGPRGAVAVPEGATVINLAGKWLLPGLIDAHIHFFQSGGLYTRPDVIDLRQVRPYGDEIGEIRARLEGTFARYIASGVTSVVDVGGPFWNFEVRRRARRLVLAPRVTAAGPLLSTYAPPAFAIDDPPIIRVTSSAMARAEVRRQVAAAADLIKIWFIRRRDERLDEELAWIRAAIDEAHGASTRVAVHATELESARLAVEAGADILVHSVDDKPVDDDFLALLKNRGVVYVTTLGVYEGYWKVLFRHVRLTEIDRALGDPAVIATFDDLDRLPAEVVPAWAKPRPIPPPNPVALANLKLVLRAGITVAAGTDAGNIGTLHGPAIHRELALMAAAGLTPMEILRAATGGGAAVVGGAGEVGGIGAGKLADLLVINADPLADIGNLRDIHAVIKGGEWFEPGAIADMLRTRFPAPASETEDGG